MCATLPWYVTDAKRWSLFDGTRLCQDLCRGLGGALLLAVAVHLARALSHAGDRTSATLELQAARALLEPPGAKPALEQADSVTQG